MQHCKYPALHDTCFGLFDDRHRGMVVLVGQLSWNPGLDIQFTCSATLLTLYPGLLYLATVLVPLLEGPIA